MPFHASSRVIDGPDRPVRRQRSDTSSLVTALPPQGLCPCTPSCVGGGLVIGVGIPGESGGGQGQSPAVAECLRVPEREIAAVAEERSQNAPSLCEACSATPTLRVATTDGDAKPGLEPWRGAHSRPCQAKAGGAGMIRSGRDTDVGQCNT